METKNTYTANSRTSNNPFQDMINWIQDTKVTVKSKTGKTYLQLPFIIALVIALLVPFALIVGIIVALGLGINITFERMEKDGKSIPTK